MNYKIGEGEWYFLIWGLREGFCVKNGININTIQINLIVIVYAPNTLRPLAKKTWRKHASIFSFFCDSRRVFLWFGLFFARQRRNEQRHNTGLYKVGPYGDKISIKSQVKEIDKGLIVTYNKPLSTKGPKSVRDKKHRSCTWQSCPVQTHVYHYTYLME